MNNKIIRTARHSLAYYALLLLISCTGNPPKEKAEDPLGYFRSIILLDSIRKPADTALRLSKYFGNSAKFWLGLQNDYDIEEASKLKKTELDTIKRYKKTAA